MDPLKLKRRAVINGGNSKVSSMIVTLRLENVAFTVCLLAQWNTLWVPGLFPWSLMSVLSH
jgi:hypothetical protein